MARTVWQGMSGSNTLMSGSKPDAFPIGESPTVLLVLMGGIKPPTSSLPRKRNYHCSTSALVPLVGLEPTLAAYLALTPYKGAVLPIEL